jgi:SWI/SNF-related matrix-associated actin-dependent regulator 1 of chromatin subfamily A
MCELSAAGRKEYDHAVKDLKSYLRQYRDSTDEQVKKSMNAAVMVKISLLKNISARGKLADAFEFIADQIRQGQKVVVFASLNDVIQKIQERFPKSVRITGKEDATQKQASIDKFQKDPKTEVAACNLKAAGTGVDGLQNAASVAVFIQFGWHSAIMDQAEDRLYRTGQNNNVMCYYFIGQDTIDEWNYELIESKRDMGNMITGAEDDVDVNVIEGVITNHETNIQQIKRQLLAGRRITVQSILRSVGTQELRHYIPIIRRRFDLQVETIWIEKKGKRFKEYFIKQNQKVA